MIKKIQYFEGKVCTVFTAPINRNFKEENPNTFPQQPYHYFMGVVESIDNSGVWLQQLHTGLKSYFFLSQIVGIAEEQVLDPDNEKDAQIINSMKATKEEIIAKYKQVENGELDIEAMTALVKNGKN